MNRGQLRVATYLLLIDGPIVLMLRRSNTGWEDGKLSLISGHVEFNESPSSAIVRESLEEAGITIELNDLECLCIVHRKCEDELVYIDYFFQTSRWAGNPTNMEPLKCAGLEWHSMECLPSDTNPYIKEVLQLVAEGKRGLLEFGWEDGHRLHRICSHAQLAEI